MAELEASKQLLKESLKRLQNIVSERIENLESENSSLRTQIIQLKQEILKLKSEEKPAAIAKKSSSKSKQKTMDPDLLSAETSSEIDLTLTELKKLVGQN